MRTITIGVPHRKFVKNTIRNQRYKWYTFVFMVLGQQFKYFFNIYFFAISFSQLFSRYSVSPLISNVIPWTMVLCASLLKEGIDDYKRYKRDKEANSQIYTIVRRIGKNKKVEKMDCVIIPMKEYKMIDVPSSEICVGDIVLLMKNQRVPADCVLLSAPDNTVFIRTDQLDGETDWKSKTPIFQNISNDELFSKNCVINADSPHKDIYSFVGTITEEVSLPLDYQNVLWMNTVLASNQAICVCIYTGSETRAVMNTITPKSKLGLIDEELNFYSKFLFALSLSAACLFTLMRGIIQRLDATVLRFLVIFSSVVPISLKVSIDCARYCFAYFIQRDIDCVVRNSSIPEELGRISYLLSDKTGTLTCNEMEMKKVHLGTLCYTSEMRDEIRTMLHRQMCNEMGKGDNNQTNYKEGLGSDNRPQVNIETSVENLQAPMGNENNKVRSIADKEEKRDEGITNPYSTENLDGQINPTPNGYFQAVHSDNVGDGMNSSIISLDKGAPSRTGAKKKKKYMINKVYDLMLGLSLCHNVTPVVDDGVTTYQASSPDEVAIVKWTESVGIKLISRNTQRIVLSDESGVHEYKILYIFPFTSESKRMGIIIQHPNDEVHFYQKGADAVMKAIVKSNDWLEEETDNMAREGLRTLIIGSKRLNEKELLHFTALYAQASNNIKMRAQEQEKAMAYLEHDLNILGLTGVEDRLQDGVKQSLESLRNAGIKVWMLTGDKIETATCIAISSKLFTKTGSIKHAVGIARRDDAYNILQELQIFEKDVGVKVKYNYLIVDGVSLQTFLNEFPKQFIKSISSLDAVVFCRCSPTQKADIATLLRKVSNERVACIGDGGNDVSMITAADVGIGIVGKEGRQASLAADFSLERFKDVCPLFLWHGRVCYKATAKLAHLVIHRGTIISVMQGIFCSLLEFSPFTMYQGTIIVFYVTLYTCLPVLASILSTDTTKDTVSKFPELYKDLRKNKKLSLRAFATWNVVSFYQGAMIILMSCLLFKRELYSIISITFSSLIVNELLMVILSVDRITKYLVFSEALSLFFYILSFKILKNELVMPCDISTFLWKVGLINIAAISFTVIQKLYNKIISPSSTAKLSID